MRAAGTAGPRLELHATDGQKHVPVTVGGRVPVEGGTIAEVSLSTANGRAVAGERSPDKRSRAPSGDLKHGTAYRLTAVATDGGGHRTTGRVTFRTLAEADRFTVTHTPRNGSTVGVGMPVPITFDKSITDRKAVESAVEVGTDSGQTVVGHWFDGQRLDFRPREYWKPHSTVTVRIRLAGVKGAAGDVVVVKNSDARTIAPDNGLNGRNMPWSRWTAGSAL